MRKLLILALLVLINIASVEALDVSVSEYDPKPAKAGTSVNVWFTIENPTSETQENIYIEIIPKDGLELTSGEPSRKKVGIIAATKSHTIQFRLFVKDDAFKGSHVIETRVLKGELGALKKDLAIEVTDKDFKGKAFYYIRVIQKDENMAWASPIWVDKK